jgi:hypothetical protein
MMIVLGRHSSTASMGILRSAHFLVREQRCTRIDQANSLAAIFLSDTRLPCDTYSPYCIVNVRFSGVKHLETQDPTG